jgi:hypothetical protein
MRYQDSVNVVSIMNCIGHQGNFGITVMCRVGHQDSASAPAAHQEDHQDSASAPTPHPHSPCPYAMGIWHLIVSGGEG